MRGFFISVRNSGFSPQFIRHIYFSYLKKRAIKTLLIASNILGNTIAPQPNHSSKQSSAGISIWNKPDITTWG